MKLFSPQFLLSLGSQSLLVCHKPPRLSMFNPPLLHLLPLILPIYTLLLSGRLPLLGLSDNPLLHLLLLFLNSIRSCLPLFFGLLFLYLNGYGRRHLLLIFHQWPFFCAFLLCSLGEDSLALCDLSSFGSASMWRCSALASLASAAARYTGKKVPVF